MKRLRVSQVSKRFGGLFANEDVSFDVAPASIVGLIGPNGAGKTTLFNCVAGVLKPTSGSIWLGEQLISGLRPEQCARHGIARTFQVAKTFSSMSTLENVMVGALLHQRSMRTARDTARDALELVGLLPKAESAAGALTVSEQRRLALARALATGPQVVLMDEVMAGLTPTEVKQAVEVVLKIRARGIACLIVEHVLEGIMPIADHIVVLDNGRKIAEGPPALVSQDPAVVAAYLGA